MARSLCFDVLVDCKKNSPCLNSNWINANILVWRRAHRVSVPHIEPTLMQRALDLESIEKAVAQACLTVRATIIGRENRAFHFIQRDVAPARLNADRIAFADRVQSGYIYPVAQDVRSDGVDNRVWNHLAIIDA